jgi:curved DNA-binding protein CbpA
MPRVDCWRLLGISPDAGAAEVRAAFARRARDVHPDGGGTGDGLTLRLLAEARDEALALLRERAERRHPDPRPPDPGREPSGGEGLPCHGCGRPFPRERLEHRLLAGGLLRGRAGSAVALVCRACAARAEEKRRNRRFLALAAALAASFLLALSLV